MRLTSDRVLGMGAVLTSLAVALESLTFRIGFYTDPLGAKGMPLIAASLIGIGGLVLVSKPVVDADWPSRSTRLHAVVLAASLIVYAMLLPVLGFLTSTTIVMTTSSMTFGGRFRRSALLAAAYTVILYVLFALVLGLPLPIGSLFQRAS